MRVSIGLSTWLRYVSCLYCHSVTLRISAVASSSRLLISSASSKLWAVSMSCQHVRFWATSVLPSRPLDRPDRSLCLCLWRLSCRRLEAGMNNYGILSDKTSQYKLKTRKCVWFVTISEMSSLLFLIRPQRMALLSWLRVSSSLCLTITSSFWAVSCSWSVWSVGTVLPLVEKTTASTQLHLFRAAYTGWYNVQFFLWCLYASHYFANQITNELNLIWNDNYT